VGHQDQSRPALTKQLDRRQRGADAHVIGNPSIVQRNVEIHSDKHPPALNLGFLNRSLWEGAGGHFHVSARK
jgi:hypothetical protein